jgi:hypothetical protein
LLRAPHPARLFAFFAVTGCGACSDDEYVITHADASAYAEARCAATSACCGEPAAADCVDVTREALLRYQDLTESPLHFSEDCMREVLAWVAKEGGIPCLPSSVLGSPNCQIAHGEREGGEACIDFGDVGFYGTDCERGYMCREGMCARGPVVLQEADLGDPCNIPGWKCMSGAYCSTAGFCEPTVGIGDACDNQGACGDAATNYCAGLDAGAGTCALRPGLDEPCVEEDSCTFECSEEFGCERLVCDDGTCSHRPPEVCV